MLIRLRRLLRCCFLRRLRYEGHDEGQEGYDGQVVVFGFLKGGLAYFHEARSTSHEARVVGALMEQAPELWTTVAIDWRVGGAPEWIGRHRGRNRAVPTSKRVWRGLWVFRQKGRSQRDARDA